MQREKYVLHTFINVHVLRKSRIKVVQPSFAVIIWTKVNKTGLQSVNVRACEHECVCVFVRSRVCVCMCLDKFNSVGEKERI